MKISLMSAAALILGACGHVGLVHAQTAVFPGGIAADSNLIVSVNGMQTLLTGSITNAATSFSVAACGTIPANTTATIDQEIMLVIGCSGTTLNIATRGFDGTTAAPHSNGAKVSLYYAAWHHNALRVEVEAIESTLLGSTPGSLTVVGPNAGVPLQVTRPNTATAGVVLQVTNAAPAYFYALSVSNSNGANSIRAADSGGTCTIGTTVSGISCTSDSRKKQDIGLYRDNALAGLMRLPVKTFEYRGSPQLKQTGFIAQDAATIFPGLVTKGEDGYLSMSYVGLIPPMVKAMQEQQSEINGLLGTLIVLMGGMGIFLIWRRRV